MIKRKIEVDMSSKAIDARMREVAQLRKLGLSIAKAKPILSPESVAAEALSTISESSQCGTANNSGTTDSGNLCATPEDG